MISLFQITSKVLRFCLPSKLYAKAIGVKVGKNVLIATKNFGSEPYLISIGNNVQISVGVMIHTHGGGNPVRKFDKGFDIFGKVVIKDWAYIGAGSQILPGVTIGEGSIVAAGSVVTKTVKDGMVVGGNPAKIICSVSNYYSKNKEFDTGTKKMSHKKKKKFLRSLPEERFIKK